MLRLLPRPTIAQTTEVHGANAEVSYERPADLDFVEREHGQVTQRGIAGAEVVQSDRYAEAFQFVQVGHVLGVVFEEDGFCDLTQPIGTQTGARSASATTSIKLPLLNWIADRLTAT